MPSPKGVGIRRSGRRMGAMKTSNWGHASELSHREWRERLEKYVRKGDRSTEPFFVGRVPLFSRVSELVIRAARDKETGSLTMAVGGAPGAGKSAFVAEAIRRYRESGLAVPVELTPDDMRPQTLVKALAKELVLSLKEETHETESASLGAMLPFLKGEGSLSETTVQPSVMEQAERDGAVPWTTLQEAFGAALNDRPILLFVDEAQTFRKNGTNHDYIPLRLHKGAGEGEPPIVPVYTGLADTAAVLRREAGLTRAVEEHMVSLSGLSQAESREYVRCVLGDYLGLRGLGVSQLYDSLAKNGDCWPQHLRSQNTAIADAMLDANSRDLGAIDMGYAEERMKTRREAYYKDRMTSVDEVHGGSFDCWEVVSEVLKSSDGRRKHELVKTAEEAMENAGSQSPDPGPFIDDMIHAGILQRRSEGGFYECPIPSFVRWIERGEHVGEWPLKREELSRRCS